MVLRKNNPVIDALKIASISYPEMRITQIMFNALDRKGLSRDIDGHPRDIFYVDDATLEQALREYARG